MDRHPAAATHILAPLAGRPLARTGALLVLAYFLAGSAGLSLVIAQGPVTLVWVPSGLAVAALLGFGPRLWPSVFLGALLVNLAMGGMSWPAALAVAAGNTGEALLLRQLLPAHLDASDPLRTLTGARSYLFAALLAPLLSAGVGTLANDLSMGAAFHWWLGDVMAILIVAPLLLLLLRRWRTRHLPDRNQVWGRTGRYGEFVLVSLGAVLSGIVLYWGVLADEVALRLAYLPFTFVLWSAMRFSQLATLALVLFISLCAVLGALFGLHPADPVHTASNLLYLYVYLFVQAVAAMMVTALVRERRDITSDLSVAHSRADEASRQKSRFMANISHEIRTPLNGIIGMTSLLLQRTPRDHRADVQLIQRSAESLLALLEDVLDHARIESGRLTVRPSPCQLRRLIDELGRLYGPQATLRDIALDVVVEPDVPAVVSVDEQRLRQILINLLSNALKFTARGRVELRVSGRHQGERAHLVFTIRDTGPGIPADIMPRIFDPFVQADSSPGRHHGGAGLGLGISRQLAALLGGSLALESEVGKGTVATLTLDLPLADHTASIPAAALLDEPEPMASSEDLAGRHVLVAEDNNVNATVVGQMLARLGCRVTLAGDGEQALASFDDSVDLVLLDCHMPRLDGYGAAHALRNRTTRTPIIALTADVTDEARQRCKDAGMDDFLAKPIRLEALETMLRRYLPPSPAGHA
jgi:signal transduction histidine kinase/CheY-like chemotaxis protein